MPLGSRAPPSRKSVCTRKSIAILRRKSRMRTSEHTRAPSWRSRCTRLARLEARMQIKLALVTVSLAACIQARGPVGATDEPIIGGTSDSSDPAVVLVRASSNQSAGLCTGELVSPHVIMTAAHCVSPQTVGSGNSFDVYFGAAATNPFQPGGSSDTWYPTQTTAYNQSFDAN